MCTTVNNFLLKSIFFQIFFLSHLSTFFILLSSLWIETIFKLFRILSTHLNSQHILLKNSKYLPLNTYCSFYFPTQLSQYAWKNDDNVNIYRGSVKIISHRCGENKMKRKVPFNVWINVQTGMYLGGKERKKNWQ